MAKLQLDDLYRLAEQNFGPLGQQAFETLVARGDRRPAEILLLGAILTKGSMNCFHLQPDMLNGLLKSAGLELDEIYNPEL